MNTDQPAQSAPNSYVDAYTPPGGNQPIANDSPQQGLTMSTQANTLPQADSQQSAVSGTSTPAEPAQEGVTSEDLADQNIFEMLGVANGTEQQKEQFLDELQQVIWEDFLQHDAQLLVSTEDFEQLQNMIKEKPSTDLDHQEKIVVYLEKRIPDLEEIMLEKALELKGDLFRERISGLREYFAGQQEKIDQIGRAEQEMQQDRWSTAARLLNSL